MEFDAMPKDDEIKISGTLEAITKYIEEQYSVNHEEAVNIAFLLAKSQHDSLIEELPYLEYPLDNDGKSSSNVARGMFANSRHFVNISELKIASLKNLSPEFMYFLLTSKDKREVSDYARMLLETAKVIYEHTTSVPDELLCICLRAWLSVGGKTRASFSVSDAQPPKECSKKADSPFVCDLTAEDGRQLIGNAHWKCIFHQKDNYCNLNEEKVKEGLTILESYGIIRPTVSEQYVFL